MSWQRILESARRNGFPVIVTDIAGREPMVVMPFDAFEEMNETYHASLEAWEEGEGIEYSDLEPVSEEVYAPPAPIEPVPPPSEPPMPTAESGEENVSHLSMEERFYLEPVDDEA